MYADWCGRFYPDGLPATKRLPFYAERFDTVEINATFYRLATLRGAEGWERLAPKGFRFVAKGSAFITHRLKLRNCEQAVSRYFERLQPLESLAVVLWQLPERFPQDLERIDAFLAMLPQHVRHAMEFRDPWWWRDEVRDLLASHRVAFCAVSEKRLPPDVVPTTDFLYVRFHGLGEQPYHYLYSEAELREWVERVKRHRRGREVYVFFNNDWYAHAIENAETFRGMLRA